MATPRKGSKSSSRSTPASSPTTSGAGGDGVDGSLENRSATAGNDLVALVRGLAAAVAEHGLSELVVDTPDATFTLRRGGSSPVVQLAAHHAPGPVVHQMAAPMMPVAHGVAPVAAAVAESPVADTAHVVTSPFVGTFYTRPNPDSSEYVRLGDRVKKNQVLCIVEAMKLMNEIEADIEGTLVGILVKDGASVEYGQPLFKIAPA